MDSCVSLVSARETHTDTHTNKQNNSIFLINVPWDVRKGRFRFSISMGAFIVTILYIYKEGILLIIPKRNTYAETRKKKLEDFIINYYGDSEVGDMHGDGKNGYRVCSGVCRYNRL